MSFTEDQYYKPSKEEIEYDLKLKSESEKMKRAALAEKDRRVEFNCNMTKMDSNVKERMVECHSAKSKILIGLLAIYGSLENIPKGALNIINLDKDL